MQKIGKVIAYLHASRNYKGGVTFDVFPCDMESMGYTLVKSKELEVTFDIPEDFSLDNEELKNLQKEKAKLMADHQVKLNEIDDRIQKYLVLEHVV